MPYRGYYGQQAPYQFSPGQRVQEVSRGLLGLSAALGRAAGPSRYPVGFGQAFGQGMQGFNQGLQSARQGYMQQGQMAQRQQLIQAQIQNQELQRQQAQAKIAQAAKQQAAMARAVGLLSPQAQVQPNMSTQQGQVAVAPGGGQVSVAPGGRQVSAQQINPAQRLRAAMAFAQAGQPQMLQNLMKPQTYSPPVKGVGPQGQPQYMQFNPQGQGRVVPNFYPPPPKALTPDRTLVPVYDKYSPTLVKMVPRAQAVGMPGPPKGMKFTSDGKGGFTLTTGGAGGLTSGLQKTTAASLEKQHFMARAGLDRLNVVASKFKPEYQQVVTRAGMAWTALKDKFQGSGVPFLDEKIGKEDRKTLEEFSSYKASSIDNLNRYIKDITGAQMSDGEAKRILRGVPNPGEGIFDGDSPIVFQGKMKTVIASLRRVMVRTRQAIGKGIDPLTIPLSTIPSMQARGDTLMGIHGKKEVVKAILKQEGYF